MAYISKPVYGWDIIRTSQMYWKIVSPTLSMTVSGFLSEEDAEKYIKKHYLPVKVISKPRSKTR